MAALMTVIVLLVSAWGSLVAGELAPASYFSNEMVIQRDKPIKIWGTAGKGTRVSVAFGGKQAAVSAGEDGKWLVTLPAMPANVSGQDFRIFSDGGDEKVISDVVLGDVWLCAGQSNMGGPIKMDPTGAKAKQDASDTLLRLLNVNVAFSPYPRDDFVQPSEWGVGIGKHLDWKSAVSFFFGQALRRDVDVPVGLVTAARGGTAIEAFLPYTSHRYLEEGKGNRHIDGILPQIKAKDLNTPEGRALFEQYLDDWKQWHRVASFRLEAGSPLPPPPIFGRDSRRYHMGNLFNNMLHPLKHVAFKGMIWYQGETNGSQQQEYYFMLKAYINSLRDFFDNPQMPFYIVQLAPYGKIDDEPGLGTGTSGVREAQRLVAQEVPNTGLAVTLDIGNPKDIHPKNKLDVGKRLARWALKNEYGFTDLVPSGPLYRSQRAQGSTIIISFDYVGSGLMIGKKDGQGAAKERNGVALEEFVVAGADKTFVRADAEIVGDTVVVSSPDVPEPRYVRYAYSASPTGNLLYNKEGLPASPFKTDSW
jgi:sialate O-acetylesterase